MSYAWVLMLLSLNCIVTIKGDTSTWVSKCYARYSGLCQGEPLTPAEQAEDDSYRERDKILNELADRTDLTAREILTLGNYLTPADAKKLKAEVDQRTKAGAR